MPLPRDLITIILKSPAPDTVTTPFPQEFITMISKTPALEAVNHDPLESLPIDATAGPCPPHIRHSPRRRCRARGPSRLEAPSWG